MKNENKNIEVVIVFMSRKKQTAKKFKKIWQFLYRFHLLLITSKAVPYAFVMCGEMWAEHSGRLFHLNIR